MKRSACYLTTTIVLITKLIVIGKHSLHIAANDHIVAV